MSEDEALFPSGIEEMLKGARPKTPMEAMRVIESFCEEKISRRVRVAVEMEREACAKIADEEAGDPDDNNGWNQGARRIAQRIRDRS